jgi:chromosome segregation ATPase
LPHLNPQANIQQLAQQIQHALGQKQQHIQQLTAHANLAIQAKTTLQQQLEQARKEAHEAHMEAHAARQEVRLIRNALENAVKALHGPGQPIPPAQLMQPMHK